MANHTFQAYLQLRRLIDAFNAQNKCQYPISFLEGEYHPNMFFEAVRGHEKDKEGGKRCEICFEMRLNEAACLAKEGGFDFFTTTLSISPLKNADKLNEIGRKLSEEYGVSYLFSDFKKKEGYKISTQLSAEYGMYRQNYCGCVFSQNNL